MRTWLTWMLALAVGGCDRPETNVSIQAEPTVSPSVTTPHEPPAPAPKFALVGDDTPLHAAADETSPSFMPKDRGAEAIVILEVDAEKTEPGWVRLATTARRSRCGYDPLAVGEVVYARRADLIHSLRAPKVIEGPGDGTRLELRPGVAVRATKHEGKYMVMTPAVRTILPLDVAEVTTEITADMLDPAETAPKPAEGKATTSASATPAPPPSGVLGVMAGARSPLSVGKLEVHLSKKRPPVIETIEGKALLRRFESPCLAVTGKLPPDPFASLGNDPFPGNLWGDSMTEAFGAGGLGLSGVELEGGQGFGFGGTGDGQMGLGTIGTIGHGERTGSGYGSGSGSLGGRKSPKLRIGSLSLEGKLPSAVVQRIARQKLGRARLCYETALRREAQLSGRILIAFTIDGSGEITGVKSVPKSKEEPTGTDIGDEAMVSCVVRAFSSLSFPAPEKGVVRVRMPLTFSPPS